MTEAQIIEDGEGGSGFGLRQKVGLVLGPLLFLLIGLYSGLPEKAGWAAATVALMSTWWIAEPIALWKTACLPLILYPLFGISRVPDLLLQYADPINFLFVGGMLIAASMEEWGLHRRVALGVISGVGTSPRRIVLGFMVATAFASLWISNTAAAVMMYPIGMAVLLKFEEQHGRKDPLHCRFGLALMLGIAYAASIGGIGTKIGTGTNFVFVKNVKSVMDKEIDFLTWLKVGMPLVLITIPVVWFYLVRVVARLPAEDFPGARETIESARKAQGPMKRGELVAAVTFLIVAALWIFRKDMDFGGGYLIPGWSRLVPFTMEDVAGPLKSYPPALAKWLAADMGDSIIAMTAAILLLIIPVENKPVRFALSLKKASGVSWGLLVMLGGGFAMAHGIQESKLSNWISGLLTGMDALGPLPLIVVACLIATALTEVASNTATASILLPIIVASKESLGMHPAPLMLAVTLSSSFGFMLPAGTPPNAVAFSSGYITVPQMARSGFVVDLAGSLLVAIVCYLIAPAALGVK